MISYGARLSDFKRSVIQYIIDKTKEGSYKNDPEDLRIHAPGVIKVKATCGDVRIEDCSIERLCNIADRIHFRPLGDLIKKESNGRATLQLPKRKLDIPEPEVITQSTDMNFEIKQNIPLPGQVLKPTTVVEKKTKTINYRTVPLKDMKVGDCIILHECDEKGILSKYTSAKIGIERFVALMDTRKKFKVAKTDDLKVGVWRIE